LDDARLGIRAAGGRLAVSSVEDTTLPNQQP